MTQQVRLSPSGQFLSDVGGEQPLFDERFIGGIAGTAIATQFGTVGETGFGFFPSAGTGQILFRKPVLPDVDGVICSIRGGGTAPHLGQLFRGSTGSSLYLQAQQVDRFRLKWNPGYVAGSGGSCVIGFGNNTGNPLNMTSDSVSVGVNDAAGANPENLRFFTRDGATTQTTDLGISAIDPDPDTSLHDLTVRQSEDGLSWSVEETESGVVLATHATNVPRPTFPVNVGGVWTGAAFVWTAHFNRFTLYGRPLP